MCVRARVFVSINLFEMMLIIIIIIIMTCHRHRYP